MIFLKMIVVALSVVSTAFVSVAMVRYFSGDMDRVIIPGLAGSAVGFLSLPGYIFIVFYEVFGMKKGKVK